MKAVNVAASAASEAALLARTLRRRRQQTSEPSTQQPPPPRPAAPAGVGRSVTFTGCGGVRRPCPRVAYALARPSLAHARFMHNAHICMCASAVHLSFRCRGVHPAAL
eukprot:197156-Prymnesium_polylepis.1